MEALVVMEVMCTSGQLVDYQVYMICEEPTLLEIVVKVVR